MVGRTTAGLQNRYSNPVLYKYEKQISSLIPSKERLQRTVAAELKSGYQPGKRILEIGAGQGDSARPVLEGSDIPLDLLDVSPEVMAAAQKNLKEFGARANFICEDALLYLEHCEPYDAIFSELTVHNFKQEDKRHLFAAIYKKLNSGGKFVLMDKVYPDTEAQELHDMQMRRYRENLPAEAADAIIAHEDEDFISDDYRLQEKNLLEMMHDGGFSSTRIIERIERDIVMVASKETRRINREVWRKNVLAIFDKMKTHKEPYEMQAGKFKITVLPNVSSPKYFTDSLWFAEALPEIVGTKSLLEVGCGTGIIALYCAQGGASVVATDINPDATRNTETNAKRHGLNISVRNGDMFAGVREGEKFDCIFWNHPFNNWDEPVNDMLLRAGLDERYNGLRRYVSEGRKHLKEAGALLLGTGDMADLESIRRITAENNYRLTQLKSTELPLEEGGNVMNSYLVYRFDQA